MHLDVAVDHVGDELRYLTFIDAARLRVADGMWSHQRPSMLMKVSAMVRAAKFFTRMGCRARSAMSNPLRTPMARASDVLPNISASRINMRPASARRTTLFRI